jgi:hypothetical protein
MWFEAVPTSVVVNGNDIGTKTQKHQQRSHSRSSTQQDKVHVALQKGIEEFNGFHVNQPRSIRKMEMEPLKTRTYQIQPLLIGHNVRNCIAAAWFDHSRTHPCFNLAVIVFV